MNEPIDFAQKHIRSKPTVRDLRDLIRGVKSRNSIYLHGEATYGRASYSDSFVFTVSVTSKSKSGVETVSKLDVPGFVSGGHSSARELYTPDDGGRPYYNYREGFRPAKGCWSLHYLEETLLDVLDLLPADMEVAFHVYLDAGSNGYMVAAECPTLHETGMHSDRLLLVAWKPAKDGRERGKPRTFIVDTSCGAHNSARFGEPKHDRDTGLAPRWEPTRESEAAS